MLIRAQRDVCRYTIYYYDNIMFKIYYINIILLSLLLLYEFQVVSRLDIIS
jgi:hypothetical protein